jgi:ribose transport system ATP-binding protein
MAAPAEVNCPIEIQFEGSGIALAYSASVFGTFVGSTTISFASGRLAATLGIKTPDLERPVATLSGGNQQKVLLARWLANEPQLLILDDPTRGIDVGAKARIYALIDELATQGRAILLVSSHVPELLGVCDRVAVMCRGRLGPARPVGEIDEHSLMQEAIGHG